MCGLKFFLPRKGTKSRSDYPGAGKTSRFFPYARPFAEVKKNWSGNITFNETQILAPSSLSDLQSLVENSSRIRVRGSGHSFNSVADTFDYALTLQNMPRILTIDKIKRVVTVSAHLTYAELSYELHSQGWALQNLASLPHISIAGSIATGTHGSGIMNGNLATAVEFIDIVDPSGNLKHINKEKADLFSLSVVSLGLGGIVTTVGLKIQPTYYMNQVIYEKLDRLFFLDNCFEYLNTGYSVSFFTNWDERKQGDLWVKSIDGSTKPQILNGLIQAKKTLHPVEGLNPSNCNEQLGVTGPWYMRLPHFKINFNPSIGDELQSEFFVDSLNASNALRKIEKISKQISQNIFTSEIRFIASDNFWLSPHFTRQSVGIHFTWRKTNEIPKIVQNIEYELSEFDYRPHLGKVFSSTPHYLSKVFPKYYDFIDGIATFDPTQKFGNTFTRHLLNLK